MQNIYENKILYHELIELKRRISDASELSMEEVRQRTLSDSLIENPLRFTIFKETNNKLTEIKNIKEKIKSVSVSFINYCHQEIHYFTIDYIATTKINGDKFLEIIHDRILNDLSKKDKKYIGISDDVLDKFIVEAIVSYDNVIREFIVTMAITCGDKEEYFNKYYPHTKISDSLLKNPCEMGPLPLGRCHQTLTIEINI